MTTSTGREESPAVGQLLLQFEPADADRMALLCGAGNGHLKLIASRLGVTIRHRGCKLHLKGSDEAIRQTEQLLKELYRNTTAGHLSREEIHLATVAFGSDEPEKSAEVFRTPRLQVRSVSPAQRFYMRALKSAELCFGIGPAGVGKTWLATAAAVQSLQDREVDRIVLVRPAVEAGERLGFLPGDLAQKLEPYQKPLYDALFEFLGRESAERLLEQGTVEVAPLAYMRGRTLNNAFILLDESQNATVEQMKMLLTRMGNGSRIAVTGDPSQSDLPASVPSGLQHALDLLSELPGVTVARLDEDSVVRHPLVRRIIAAYAAVREKPGTTRRSTAAK